MRRTIIMLLWTPKSLGRTLKVIRSSSASFLPFLHRLAYTLRDGSWSRYKEVKSLLIKMVNKCYQIIGAVSCTKVFSLFRINTQQKRFSQHNPNVLGVGVLEQDEATKVEWIWYRSGSIAEHFLWTFQFWQIFVADFYFLALNFSPWEILSLRSSLSWKTET